MNADAAALAEQQKKVDAAQKEYSDAFDALIAANSKLDELTADYQKKVSAAETAKAEMDAAQSNADQKENAQNTAKAEMDAKKDAVSKSESNISDAQNSKANAESNAEKAKNELDAAKAALDAAKAAAEEAKKQEALGSKGFFDSIGETAASDLFSQGDYPDKTNMGAEDDATSLKNMLYALDFIEKSNELRRANNLEEFKISARAMAAAQYQANASLHTEDHTFQFGYGENLAWGMDDPEIAYMAWYDSEKDSTILSERLHYLALVSANNTVTGFGLCYNRTNPDLYSSCESKVFGSVNDEDEGYCYTVAEFRALLQAYIDKLTKAQTDLDKAQADYDAKLAAYNAAQDEVAKWDALLKQYQNENPSTKML